MDLKEELQRLGELQTRLYAYNCASSSLYLDGVTVALAEDDWEVRF